MEKLQRLPIERSNDLFHLCLASTLYGYMRLIQSVVAAKETIIRAQQMRMHVQHAHADCMKRDIYLGPYIYDKCKNSSGHSTFFSRTNAKSKLHCAKYCS